MSKSANDILESLFLGIDTIVDKKLQNVSFDTTIICTVVDDSDAKNGVFQVTDGTITFTAYADVDKYLAGDQVRVSIPMGDYTQKKFILGKYVTDNDSNPITYISPIDKVVNVSGNLAFNKDELNSIEIPVEGGIVANGQTTSKVLWNRRLENEFLAMQGNNIFNTLILKGDFKTLLSNYDLISGNYGLKVDLLVRPSANSAAKVRRTIELDSKEMFGNPYAFSIPSPQAKIFSIDTIGIIEAIELSLYQNGNFQDKISGPIVPFGEGQNNIFVNNIVLGLGYEVSGTEDNTLQIFTQSDPQYVFNITNDNAAQNIKKMGLLWLNKDEDNQYIGFTDGIYDPDYDEDEYLSKATLDNRLLAQKGRDGIPSDRQSLELAANFEDAKPLIQSALQVITVDIQKVLRELQPLVRDVELYATNLEKFLSSQGEFYIQKTYADVISSNLATLEKKYKDILSYGYSTWTKVSPAPTWKEEWNNRPDTQILNAFESLKNKMEWLFSIDGGFAGIDGAYSGLRSIYDTYSIRMKRMIAAMEGYLGLVTQDRYGVNYSTYASYNKTFPLSVLNGTDANVLSTYRTRPAEDYIIYKETDLSGYDNKYCIYWYRYEQDYKGSDLTAYLPEGWRRLTPEETGGRNLGLPGKLIDDAGTAILNKEGKPTHALKLPAGEGMLTRTMDNNSWEERYIAVLFYNHVMYKSNELKFINKGPIPDKTTLDKGDILIFEHLANSADDFQSYAMTNYLMDSSDESRVRQLRCHYDGLLAKDNALVNSRIYWYVPNASTMLAVDVDDLLQKGFSIDDTESTFTYSAVEFTSYKRYVAGKYFTKNASNQYSISNAASAEAGTTYYEKSYSTYCFYKTVTAEQVPDYEDKIYDWEKWNFADANGIDSRDFWYKIRPYYDYGAVNNTISCVVYRIEDEDPVRGEQLFTFGLKGSSGTKYTLAITNNSNRVAAYSDYGLALKAQLKDFNNTPLGLIQGAGESDDGKGHLFNISWDAYQSPSGNTNVPLIENLEFLNSEVICNTQAGYYGIIKATAQIALNNNSIHTSGAEIGKFKTVDLEVLHAIPYGDEHYYIQGPTQIIYNSLGTLDGNAMFNTPYKLFCKKTVEINGVTYRKDEEIAGVTWNTQYYKKSGSRWVTLSAGEEQNFYNQYMPKIQGNNLVPSPMYLSNGECYCVVEAKIGATVYWRQPIIILQNKYASSMLNDWDGSLTIDEKNGTILSTMVGAGRKTSKNTFEGVLMGDIALGTSSNLTYERGDDIGLGNHTGMGLYGFHDGEQSFGFNVDGTAFLGKSGAGRIIFNGNVGVIASANWFETGRIDTTTGGISRTGTTGMCIDLTNGHLDAYNFRLTSKNIYFNSNPEDGHLVDNTDPFNNQYFFKIGNDSKGYISLSADGELVIRTNSFYLTGTLGNGNILRQTSPRKHELVPQTYTVTEITANTQGVDINGNPVFTGTEQGSITVSNNNNDANGTVHYTWKVDVWTSNELTTSSVSGTDNTEGEKSYWIEAGNGRLVQNVSLKPNTDYTVSGYIKTAANKTLQFFTNGSALSEDSVVYSNLDDEIDYGTYPFTISDENWHYFRCTFTTGATVSTFGFECNSAFKLWHAKLEEGSVATDWTLAAQDIEENAEHIKDNYDYYLTQDRLFDKLFTDPKTGLMTDGIALVSPDQTISGRQELFINATYIASGILRSKNYDGQISIRKNDDGEYEYSVSKHPENGMYIDLEHGKMWAAKFELDAWSRLDPDKNGGEGGLYLNSHPKTATNANGYKYAYYLKLGRENGNFITFDADGNLKMRVNSLEITAPLGGTNLLHQTSPRETVHVVSSQTYADVASRTELADGSYASDETVGVNNQAPYDDDGEFHYTWKLDKWTAAPDSGILTGAGKIENGIVPDKPYYLTGSTNFYQEVEDLRSTHTYTLSGWFQFNASSGSLTLNLGSPTEVTFTCLDGNNLEKATTLPVSDSEWHYFYCTFEKPQNKNIGFQSTTSFNLWHAKLERGTVATEWSMSPTDVEENANAEVRKLDTRLLQDQIFEKLFKDPISGQMTDGIVLRKGNETLTGRPELFINATYIASGIIRSKNWDGLIKATKSGNKYDYTIQTHPTKGMYIDLDNGIVWAARFELNAWNTEGRDYNEGNGLYLNSHPNSSNPELNYYLKLGNTNNSYITFDAEGNFKMRVNSFELTGSFGGANLLNNTAPRQRYKGEEYQENELQSDGTTEIVTKTQDTAETLGGILTDLNKQDYWTADKATSSNSSGQKSILLGNNGVISQDIQYGLISDEEYMLSCRVYSTSSNAVVNFNLSDCTVLDTYTTSHSIPQNKWYVVNIAFRRAVLPNTSATLTVSMSSGSAHIHHLKLEEGTVATQWCKSEQDKQDDAEAYTNGSLTAYNTAMNQEQVFKKLTTDANGNVMKGIWLLDSAITGRKELYISATYMSTGILRSENFDGTLTEDGVDSTGHTKYKVTGGSKGMYINMNTGYIWAKTFNLNTDNIYLGDAEKTFTINGKSVDAVLRMGNAFAVTSSGVLYASNIQSIGTISGGTISGATIVGGSLSIGAIDDGYNFTVTSAGVMTAKSATITGNITASTLTATGGGTIGGWTINSDSLTCNGFTIKAGSSPYIGNSGAGAFNVNSGGYMTATGANLTDLTVTNKLSITGTAELDCDGSASFDGNVTLTGKIAVGQSVVSSSYNLYVAEGLSYFGGNIGIGTAASNSYSVTMGGDINIGGVLHVNGATAMSDGAEWAVNIDGPWLSNGFKLTFKNGILTNAEKLGAFDWKGFWGNASESADQPYVKISQINGGTISQSTELYIPTSTGTSGQALISDGKSGGVWTSLTGFTEDKTNRKYKVQSGTNGYYVQVPNASATYYGLVKTGYTTNATNREYAVLLSSEGKMYVKVPWTDTTIDSLDWDDITGKPSSYWPSNHDHTGTRHRHKITIDGKDYYTEYTSMTFTGVT